LGRRGVASFWKLKKKIGRAPPPPALIHRGSPPPSPRAKNDGLASCVGQNTVFRTRRRVEGYLRSNVDRGWWKRKTERVLGSLLHNGGGEGERGTNFVSTYLMVESWFMSDSSTTHQLFLNYSSIIQLFKTYSSIIQLFKTYSSITHQRFISDSSTIHQLFINYSTIHQLFISDSSAIYQRFINYSSTIQLFKTYSLTMLDQLRSTYSRSITWTKQWSVVVTWTKQ
jgi:hypothetical protein